MPIQIFKISGNFHHVGLEIGKKFQREIKEFFDNYEALHTIYIPFYETHKGYEVYNILLNHSTKLYPGYIDEIKGYSEGSGLPFFYFFLMLIRVEIVTFQHQDSLGINECSDVFLKRENLKILGHNEDMSCAIKGRGYILDCEIYENEILIESFFAYSYPGHLPGNCMGYNRLGNYSIIITMDGLSALHARIHHSTPRGILCRAVIGKGSSFQMIKTILKDQGHGSTVGFSVNIVELYQDDIKMYNIEVSPSNEHELFESNLDILEIDSSTPYYFHFNKYEHTPNIKEIPDHIINSKHRQISANDYENKHGMHSKQDVINVLGDTSDPKYPIYRDGFKDDTLATGIFDFTSNTWEIYEDNPKHSQPLYCLHF